MTDTFTGTLETDVGSIGQQTFQTSYIVPQNTIVDSGYTQQPTQTLTDTSVDQSMILGTIGTIGAEPVVAQSGGDNKLLIILGIALIVGFIAVI